MSSGMLTPCCNDYSFLMVSSECCSKLGQAGFYSVLPLACLLWYWLFSKACSCGQVNHYRLLVADIAWKEPFTVTRHLTLEQVAAWFGARSRERRDSCCVERQLLAKWVFPQVLQAVPFMGYVPPVSFCYLLICLPKF
jgi:hypothetical protein